MHSHWILPMMRLLSVACSYPIYSVALERLQMCRLARVWTVCLCFSKYDGPAHFPLFLTHCIFVPAPLKRDSIARIRLKCSWNFTLLVKKRKQTNKNNNKVYHKELIEIHAEKDNSDHFQGLCSWKSHVMRLWHFSSSVNLFFERACAAIQWG